MNEVLFELYNVPSVGYGIDSLFSLQHNCTTVQDALGNFMYTVQAFYFMLIIVIIVFIITHN